jgi:nucleoside-triphosphatase THEP1
MKPSSVFIITGKQGEGKTTKLAEVIRILKQKEQAVFGFYAIGAWENGQRSHFHIKDINSGESFLLCERQEIAEAGKSRFVFFQQAINKGGQIIAEGMKRQKALAVIDEIGPFELKEEAWHNALTLLIKNDFPILITVRERLLKTIIREFGIERPVIFRLEENCTSIAGKIMEQLAGTGKSGH